MMAPRRSAASGTMTATDTAVHQMAALSRKWDVELNVMDSACVVRTRRVEMLGRLVRPDLSADEPTIIDTTSPW